MGEAESTATSDPREVQEQIRSWFEEIGWTVEDRPVEEGVAWRLRARNRGGQTVLALQGAARPDILLLGGSVAPSAPHEQKLAALPPKILRSFLWDLRFELLRRHYQFQIQGPGIRGVAFNRVLYWDEGIRRSQFVAAVEEIHHGVLTVQWMIQRLLDEPPPPEVVRVVGSEPIN